MCVGCISDIKWTDKGEKLKSFELCKLGYFSVVNERTIEKKMKRKQLEKSVFEERFIFRLHSFNSYYQRLSETIISKFKCVIFSVTFQTFSSFSKFPGANCPHVHIPEALFA